MSAVPGGAGRDVLERHATGGELGPDAVGLGEVLGPAGGVAPGDQGVDLIVALAGDRAIVEFQTQDPSQGVPGGEEPAGLGAAAVDGQVGLPNRAMNGGQSGRGVDVAVKGVAGPRLLLGFPVRCANERFGRVVGDERAPSDGGGNDAEVHLVRSGPRGNEIPGRTPPSVSPRRV